MPTLSQRFGDVFCPRVRGHLRVEGGVIQGPLVFPAGGLNQSGQVGLGDVEAREPHHLWLPLVNLQSQRTTCGTCFSRHAWLSCSLTAIVMQ